MSRQRALRALAGVAAAFLLSGQVLAAAGLCAMKASERPASAPLSAQAEPPCPQHIAEDVAPAPAAQQHCPADDPTAQLRAADAGGALTIAPPPSVPLTTQEAPRPLLSSARDTGDPFARPLYARLQRLRL